MEGDAESPPQETLAHLDRLQCPSLGSIVQSCTAMIGTHALQYGWRSGLRVSSFQSHLFVPAASSAKDRIAHEAWLRYLLGYMPEQSKLYLIDKELNAGPSENWQDVAGSLSEVSGDTLHAAHGPHRVPVGHHAEGLGCEAEQTL